MTKRPPLQFELPKTPTKKAASEQDTNHLSPSKITTPDEHATVMGLLASLSPIKPLRYFDGELTNGESVIRLVGFNNNANCYHIPITEYLSP